MSNWNNFITMIFNTEKEMFLNGLTNVILKISRVVIDKNSIKMIAFLFH